ncbi:gliding motility-associated C-terminal domain-containing protein [Chitinophaga filiformis]|uniref:Gliding motility-associated C-terminal domain-containing protein n=1 Tax=Chitinophaga filiformis TaxID=104663 RepID=A0A1G7LP79_CHIFI|nr:gliding motility-associated C-terminal domain-containing protein [Chitinophaga filiformis]SDF51201.1 gliding motility-associated C-terminal domain-containing protein [Chitinophaga filiformis]
MKPTTGVLLLLVAISCFCVLTPTMAANFIVTSNADSGPGTLRDAITKANSNGTATKDYIYFNLPGTQPADVTITLLTDLPGLRGNIAVDASTQAAPLLGASGARVILYRQVTGAPATYYALMADNAQQVEIYGLAIKNTLNSNIEGHGIELRGACSDIIIGSPGKGNIINGYKYCIYGDSGNFDPKTISNLVIQSNIIGFEEDGVTTTAQLSSYQPILLTHLNGVTLGGNSAALGNVIMGNYYGVSLRTDAGNVVASFNKIGTDVNGTGVMNFSVRDEMLGIYGTTTGTVMISDNQVAGVSDRGIGILGLQNATFRIVRNKIGTEVTGQNVLGQRSSGILITDCNQGIIGGSLADKNIIAGCYDAPVNVINAYRVTVSQNEMFCNNVTSINRYPANSIQLGNWNPSDGRPMPFVHVIACTASTLSGTATPNAKMEVFTPYRCSGSLKCDGRNYIETFFAGADGKWTYALKGRDGVIISATDAAGATSDYSNPVWSDHIELERGIVHTACGKSTGSIPNKLLYNATPFHWEDGAGNTVGTDTSLNNVPAGQYRLVMYGGGCNKPECIVYSAFYEVKDETPAITTGTVIITPATCGANNGSINGLQIKGINLKYQWRNAANAVVGTGPTLSNLAPDSYTLTITDTVNGCTATGGPFVVKGVVAPVLDATGAIVKNAICSQPTGSVTGLKVTGTGVITYTWKDASQQVVGTTPDLLNMPAGVYVLSFTDESSCPALPSAPFTITAPGLITIDQSRVVIKDASCAADDGGVTGLQATNAETVRWMDQNGVTVGNSLDLTNMPAGTYTLQIRNTIGCSAMADFTVPKHKPSPMNVTQINTQNPVCNLKNGSVTGLVVVGGTPASYKWFDDSGALVGQNRDLVNVGDGTYKVYITDTEQCEQLVTTVTLKTPDLPVIDTKSAYVIDDVCNTTSGMITGISVAGKQPISYAWLNEDSTVVSAFLRADGLPGGSYTLQVTDGYGCIVYSAPFPVLMVDILLLAPAAKDVTILKGMTAEIKVNDKRVGIYTLFKPGTEWSASNDTGLFRIPGITETTTFGMTYQFGDCISPTTTIQVHVIDGIKVVAPTAFSPNGDGRNDIFKPKGYGVAAYNNFSVMDRWGNVVFTTKNIEAGWDGTYRGKKVDAGAYVWMIQGIDILGHPVQEKGAVLVVY